MKKFNPMKVKNSSIQLPEDFLDILLINDGDRLVLVEDNGRYYLRKTFEKSNANDTSQTESQVPPPPSIDEMMKKAQQQFSDSPNMPNMGPDFMKTIENTFKDPEMMKKIQDMASTFMSGIFDQNKTNSNSSNDEELDDDDEENDEELDDDDDENDSGYKIDIE